jgi:hypothetical protein
MEELIQRYKTASGEAQQGDGCSDQLRMVKSVILKKTRVICYSCL